MPSWIRTGVIALTLVACDKDGDTDVVDTEVDDTVVVDTEVDDTDVVDTDATAPTCATYCAAVTLACTGDQLQYPSVQVCEQLCAGVGLAVGSASDTSGNTLGCRSYHAAAAATDPATHCAHAGLLGGDVCGGTLENFCAFDLFVCAGNDAYASQEACEADAATWSPGSFGDTSGNTLACRAYHLAAAVGGSPSTHCPHTAADGGGVCVD